MEPDQMMSSGMSDQYPFSKGLTMTEQSIILHIFCLELMGGFTSSETRNSFLEIVKKYPAKFPEYYAWYFTVPDEVHADYKKEMLLLSQSTRKRIEKLFIEPLRKKNWIEQIFALFNPSNRMVKQQKKDLLIAKKVWNKHYKKYGIRFNKSKFQKEWAIGPGSFRSF